MKDSSFGQLKWKILNKKKTQMIKWNNTAQKVANYITKKLHMSRHNWCNIIIAVSIQFHRMIHMQLKFMLLTELNLRHSKAGNGRQSTWHHFSPPVCFSTSLIKQMNNYTKISTKTNILHANKNNIQIKIPKLISN